MTGIDRGPEDPRELEDLRRTWQADDAPAAGTAAGKAARLIIRRVRRRSRRLALAVAADVIITLLVFGLFIPRMLRTGHPADLLGCVAVGALTLAALGFGLLNRRGTWRPAGASARDHLDLLDLRCRRSLRMARFGAWFLAFELAFLVPWVWSLIARRPGGADGIGPVLFATAWFAIMGGGMFAWLAWYARRVRREQAELARLRGAILERDAG